MANSIILKELIDKLDVSIRSFERKINVGGSAITRAIERNTKIKEDTVDKILKAYPNVNRKWLETGTGDMFISAPTSVKSSDTTENSELEGDIDALKVKLSQDKQVIIFGKESYYRLRPDEYTNAFRDWRGVPMYNVPVTASFVETYRDESVFHPQYYLHDPRFKDCNFGAIITGDSMYSEIRHGDFVVCQEITDKRFVVFGDIYYVVSSNGLETCKYLNADPNSKENYLLVPRNENISPSPIPKDMITRLFKVRGVLRGY